MKFSLTRVLSATALTLAVIPMLLSCSSRSKSGSEKGDHYGNQPTAIYFRIVAALPSEGVPVQQNAYKKARDLSQEFYFFDMQKSTQSFSNHIKDVIPWMTAQCNLNLISWITEGKNGLVDIAHVDLLLKKQEYVEVLGYLLSEPDLNKRIEWLKRDDVQLHAPMKYQLSIEMFCKSRDLTQAAEADALAKVAIIQLLADINCCRDESTRGGYQQLVDCDKAVITAREADWSSAAREYMSREIKCEICSETYYLTLLAMIEEELISKLSLPPPKWVVWHGLRNFQRAGRNIFAYDEAYFSEARVEPMVEEAFFYPEAEWPARRDEIYQHFHKIIESRLNGK